VKAGIRVVTMRSGVVLSPIGGGLRKQLLPFRLGIGGKLAEQTLERCGITVSRSRAA
jgi:NAD dependent epimerase/dehydratase family enzyme